MTGLDMQEVRREATEIERLIFHACRAGAFRAAARVYVEAAPTFERAADLNSAKARGLALEIATGAAATAPSRAAR